jgi:hypothetical protein
MSCGSSMLAMIFSWPPQRAQHSISTPSTRFSRLAQLIATCRGVETLAGSASDAGGRGAPLPRCTEVRHDVESHDLQFDVMFKNRSALLLPAYMKLAGLSNVSLGAFQVALIKSRFLSVFPHRILSTSLVLPRCLASNAPVEAGARSTSRQPMCFPDDFDN